MNFVRIQIQRLLPIVVVAGLFVLGMDRAAQQRMLQEQRLAPFSDTPAERCTASRPADNAAPRFTRYWRVIDPVIR